MIVQKIYWHILAIIKIVIYKILFGKSVHIPLSTTFRERFNLTIVEGGKVDIGENVFFNHDCSITAAYNSISIDDGTIFGENVKIYCHNHRYQNTTIHIKRQGYTSAPISIGKNCWISSNVVILKGVTIGDNVVVGAGCIIYKDIPANTIVINKQELILKSQIREQRNVPS